MVIAHTWQEAKESKSDSVVMNLVSHNYVCTNCICGDALGEIFTIGTPSKFVYEYPYANCQLCRKKNFVVRD